MSDPTLFDNRHEAKERADSVSKGIDTMHAVAAPHPTTAASEADTPSVVGRPKLLLRLEGVAMLACAVAAYATLDASWTLFVAAFLAPDLSMLGYLAGPRIGAAAYNGAHTLLAPAACAALAFVGVPLALPSAAIWLGHIGFDRALGYGLKYEAGFAFTHLGRAVPGPR
jgi:hypothetical protein